MMAKAAFGCLLAGVLGAPPRKLDRVGVKAAQARGVKFGRKPKLSPAQIDHARQQIEYGRRVQDIAALLNVGRTTLYRALIKGFV